MSGRRSHIRFTAVPSPSGALRVMRDVVVESVASPDIVIISRDPGVLNDVVIIQPALDSDLRLRARVIDSQPVIVDGVVRHRVHLREIGRLVSRPDGRGAQ